MRFRQKCRWSAPGYLVVKTIIVAIGNRSRPGASTLRSRSRSHTAHPNPRQRAHPQNTPAKRPAPGTNTLRPAKVPPWNPPKATESATTMECHGATGWSRCTPGNGLSLSLFAAVARFHGAKIKMADTAPGFQNRASLLAASQIQRGNQEQAKSTPIRVCNICGLPASACVRRQPYWQNSRPRQEVLC